MGGNLTPKEIVAKARDARVNVKRLSDWKRQLKQAQFDMLAQGGRAEDARLKKQGGQRSAFSEEFITKAAEQLVEAAKTGNAIRKKAKRKQLDSAGCLIAAAKTLPSMLADENANASLRSQMRAMKQIRKLASVPKTGKISQKSGH